MVALLRELVPKGEPVLLYESPESLHRAVVRVKENLSQRNNLEEEEGKQKKKKVFFLFLFFLHAYGHRINLH